jgi:hypothetical protein
MPVNLRHLEILYGLVGARDKFEEMTIHLIRSKHPTARRVRIVRGDGGIDAHDGSLADPDGVDVFQIKYFPISIDESQRNQIRESFKRVRESKDFTTKSWTLCLPIDMSVDEQLWFDEWAAKQSSSGIEIRPVWGAIEIERLLVLPANQDVRETYFQQEHMQLLREMKDHLRQLLEEVIDRIPKSEPIVLEARLESASVRDVHADGNSAAMIEVQIKFAVTNKNGPAADVWDVTFELQPPDVSLSDRFRTWSSQPSHQVLLPNGTAGKIARFGFRILKDSPPLSTQLRDVLFQTRVCYKTVSAKGPGEPYSTPVGEVTNPDEFLRNVRTHLINQLSWGWRDSCIELTSI